MPVYKSAVENHLVPYWLSEFAVQTLVVESRALRDNPLADPSRRYNPVLVPRAKPPRRGWPVVMVLAGFTGNGPQYFAGKSFEANLVQVLNQCRRRQQAPEAIFVFPDTMTFWGGSQYLNSAATGAYEDYVIRELIPSLRENFPVQSAHKKWAIVGGSSGGYGALHLASRYPQIFHWVAASAPDSGFQWSLLPDLYLAGPYLRGKKLEELRADLSGGHLLKRREGHAILNAIGMAACYSPRLGSERRGEFDFPVDFVSGQIKKPIWRKWQKHDPINFLKQRRAALRTWGGVYLDVGIFDQYYLYYGARQIVDGLRAARVKVSYHEFAGNHFDLHTRRPMIWKWLAKKL